MASQSFFSEEELQRQQQGAQGPATQAGGQVLAGGNAAPTGPAASSGTGYTNLETYLKANAGQGAGLAKVVTGDAQNKINDAKNAAGAFETGFKNDVNANLGSRQQNFIDQIKDNPTAVDKPSLQTYLGGAYAGPTNATGTQGFQDVSAKFKTANDTFGRIDDRDARRPVIAAAVQPTPQAGQQYTKGMSNLDSFIMNNDDASKNEFNAFKANNQGFDSDFSGMGGRLDKYASDAAATDAARRKEVADTLSNTISGLQTSVKTRLKDAKNKEGQIYNDLVAKYGANNVGRPLGQMTRENVITEEDRIRSAALSGLAGIDDPLAGVRVASRATPWVINRPPPNPVRPVNDAAAEEAAKAFALPIYSEPTKPEPKKKPAPQKFTPARAR